MEEIGTLNVLIAEDNDIHFKFIIESIGYAFAHGHVHYDRAATRKELEQYRSEKLTHYDFIILDGNLSGGRELETDTYITAIVQEDGVDPAKIIANSADSTSRLKMKRAGARWECDEKSEVGLLIKNILEQQRKGLL